MSNINIIFALMLLREAGLPDPDISLIDLVSWSSVYQGDPDRAVAGGWNPVTKRIAINTDAEPYRLADQTGYAVPLASVIAHEWAHACGGDEIAAYDAALEVVGRM